MTTDDTTPAPARVVPEAGRRVVSLLAGAALITVFYGLDETATTMQVGFRSIFSYSSSGEVYFWLAHAMLLVPAGCLIGWGLAPWVGDWLAGGARRIEALERREAVAGLVLCGILGMLVARVSRAVFLLDLPVTDDENGVRFGGQVLATGRAAVEVPPLYEHMPHHYAAIHDGMVTSFDWPGGQVAWALAELTGLGSLVHALIAAVPIVALGWLLGRRLGRVWGAVAVLFVAFSPMAFALSMTTHAHLVSRACLAVGMACYGVALHEETSDDGARTRLWAGVGLAFGAAFASRPYETMMLVAPLAAWLAWRAVREPVARRALVAALAGLAVMIALFMWHSAAVTGDPLTPARMASGAFADSHIGKGGIIPGDFELFYYRFGANLSYNLFMLTVWFLGPLGVLLVILGIWRDRFTQVLSIGIVLLLLLALGHDNHGVHHVGPIHYADAVVPLTILAVYGLHHLRGRVAALGLSTRPLAAVVTVVVVLALGMFNMWHGGALQKPATLQAAVYDFLDEQVTRPSVVLVPPHSRTWRAFPELGVYGSWVLHWRHNSPTFDDRVLLVHDVPGVARRAAQVWPERPLLRLGLADKGYRLLVVDPALEPVEVEPEQR